MDSTEQWSFTILRARGLSFLRTERSWRPIVTITVDEHDHHETVLGSDGQNPNQKAQFYLQSAIDMDSRVDVKVWHKSQSKKKGKRRNLVATACHSLGSLLKRQAFEAKLEVRLNCQLPPKRGCATKGKPHNGAFVAIRIRPPASFNLSFILDESSNPQSDDDSSDVVLSDTLGRSDKTSSSRSSSSHSEDELDATGWDPPKKARIRGYMIGSEDDESYTDDCDDDEKKGLLKDQTRDGHNGASEWEDERDLIIRVTPDTFAWLTASILPSYTEKVATETSPIRHAEHLLSHFTTYMDLKNATLDSHYEAVFVRLQQEWTYVGGLLVALAAVDTAVLSMSSGPGSLFNVDRYAQNAIAASSVASGLGIACDAWFLLRYNWADLHTFQTRARDIYDSYFFFSLSSRLPSLSMLISALSLLAFLGRVAYNSWPEAVIIICLFFGVVMVLQFLVFGAHWCIRRVVDGIMTASKWILRVFERIRGRPASPPPYNST